MRASKLIQELQRLSKDLGGDPFVVCQTAGCCSHGHEVFDVETSDKGTDEDYRAASRESDVILLRAH